MKTKINKIDSFAFFTQSKSTHIFIFIHFFDLSIDFLTHYFLVFMRITLMMDESPKCIRIQNRE